MEKKNQKRSRNTKIFLNVFLICLFILGVMPLLSASKIEDAENSVVNTWNNLVVPLFLKYYWIIIPGILILLKIFAKRKKKNG